MTFFTLAVELPRLVIRRMVQILLQWHSSWQCHCLGKAVTESMLSVALFWFAFGCIAQICRWHESFVL
jgi:hypothetical protein